MRWRLLNFAAAMALVLMIATLTLWVRSYWRVDMLVVGRLALVSGKGKVGLHHRNRPTREQRLVDWGSQDVALGNWIQVPTFVPLTYTDPVTKSTSWQCFVPTWFAAGMCGFGTTDAASRSHTVEV